MGWAGLVGGQWRQLYLNSNKKKREEKKKRALFYIYFVLEQTQQEMEWYRIIYRNSKRTKHYDRQS